MKNVIFHCKNIIHSHCIALLRCLFWIHKTSSTHAPGSTKGNLSWNNHFKRVSLNSQPCPQPFSLQMCSKYSHNDRGWNDKKILIIARNPTSSYFQSENKSLQYFLPTPPIWQLWENFEIAPVMHKDFDKICQITSSCGSKK